jgi:hypothetical protein
MSTSRILKAGCRCAALLMAGVSTLLTPLNSFAQKPIPDRWTPEVKRMIADIATECPKPKEVDDSCPWPKQVTTTQRTGPDDCSWDSTCERVVTITPGTNGRLCTAELPYGSLTVQHQGRSRQVTWVLRSAPRGYGFDQDSAGGFGIRLSKPTSGTSDPGDVWGVVVHTTTRHTIETKARQKYDMQAFCHYPRVRGPDKKLCCPIDPMIINEPN